MDPVSLVVCAIAAGATAGLTDTVSSSIKDSHAALKRLLAERYGRVNLSGLESSPTSAVQQAAIRESFTAADVQFDDEVISVAKSLLLAVTADAPNATRAVGLDVARLEVDGAIEIRDIKARDVTGGVIVHDVTAKSLSISGIDVDGAGSHSHPR